MRFILASALLLGSCANIQRNNNHMTPEQMLQRSTHIFIGVIEKQEFPNRFLFRVSGEDAEKWRVFRRRVHVETVLRGNESRPVIDIYEAFPTDGLSGDWNSTHENQRYLFPVRLENGRYHLVQDIRGRIYPILSGRHNSLPLDDSRPFWERFALLQWWIQPDRSAEFGHYYSDPGGVFGRWRLTKVLRGLLRHPDGEVRLAACEELIYTGSAQDECWDSVGPSVRQTLDKVYDLPASTYHESQRRTFEMFTRQSWDDAIAAGDAEPSAQVMDNFRLITTINDAALRREFCVKFKRKFPLDRDNGCPADRPPPATIVTKDGDIPLVGEWPATARP